MLWCQHSLEESLLISKPPAELHPATILCTAIRLFPCYLIPQCEVGDIFLFGSRWSIQGLRWTIGASSSVPATDACRGSDDGSVRHGRWFTSPPRVLAIALRKPS